jgi:ferredoxin
MVKVDEEKCIGCGSCVAACEEVFEMVDTDDGQKAKVKGGSDASNECVKEAIDICPTDAIV